MMTSRFNWPGTCLILALLAAWEVGARAVASPSFPGFGDMLATLVQDGGFLASQMLITLSRAATGFGIALVIMLPLGIVIGRAPRFASYVEPLIDLLRPLPPLAVVPVAMLFMGTGSAAKIAVVFYGAAFPILLNAIDATRSTHPRLIQAARSIGLTQGEIMRRIDLPAAMPQVMAGVRVSLGLALLISVSAEMILSTDGAGSYLMRAHEQFRIAGGLACLAVIAVVSLAVNAATRRIEHRLLAWHYLRRSPV